MVILTGDIVTQDNSQEAYRRFADVFSEVNNPWAMVFGNHDTQDNLSGKDNKPEALLYMMDSNTGSTLNPVVTGDGWFEFDQINWYRFGLRAGYGCNFPVPCSVLPPNRPNNNQKNKYQ